MHLIVNLENPPRYVDRGMVWLKIPSLGLPRLIIGIRPSHPNDQFTVESLRETHRIVLNRMTTVIQDIMTLN